MDNLPVINLTSTAKSGLPICDKIEHAELFAKALLLILSELGIFADPERTELGISIVDDEEILKLNTIHRGIDKPTDVLSFPIYIRDEFPLKLAPADPPRIIGDIMISVEMVSRQASERDLSFSERFTEAFIHGILHLLGYEHDTDHDRGSMEETEDSLFEKVLEILQSGL
jgi:rRNA maturation RNase YbeY